MSRELGADVQVGFTRKELSEPGARTTTLVDSLCTTGTLAGSLRIPNTVGGIALMADLRTARITASVDIDAPNEGRQTTRVAWLSRQIPDARADTRIDATVKNGRSTTSALLGQARENPALLVDDPKRDIRAFTVSQTRPMGPKRGAGRGGFIDSVLATSDDFYAEVVQRLRPFAAKAPRANHSEDDALLAAGVDTTPDQEGREILASARPEAAVPSVAAPVSADASGAQGQQLPGG